jgi:hypothetical protein
LEDNCDGVDDKLGVLFWIISVICFGKKAIYSPLPNEGNDSYLPMFWLIIIIINESGPEQPENCAENCILFLPIGSRSFTLQLMVITQTTCDANTIILIFFFETDIGIIR